MEKIIISADDLKLHVVIDGKEQVVDGAELCKIDPERLDEEFIEFPSVFVFWNSIYSLYQKKLAMLEFKLSKIEAKLDSNYRSSLDEKERKMLKEREVKDYVLNNEVYQTVMEEYLEVEGICKSLRALLEGLEKKGQMLIQIGSKRKLEMKLDSFGI